MKKCLSIIISICLCATLFFVYRVPAKAEDIGTYENPYNISELNEGTVLNLYGEPILSSWVYNDTNYVIYVVVEGSIVRSVLFSNDKEDFTSEGKYLSATIPVGEKHSFGATPGMGYKVESVNLAKPPHKPVPQEETKQPYTVPLENQIAALGASIESDADNESTGGSSTGGTTTVTWNEGGALPLAVMQKLAENPNVTLEFTFTYEGVEHTVVIPAGTAIFDESIPWYGPEWLLTFYPEKGSTTSNGAYTIQPGDTLGSLARRLGTTVEKLMALNPYITDPGKIYVGDKINY